MKNADTALVKQLNSPNQTPRRQGRGGGLNRFPKQVGEIFTIVVVVYPLSNSF